MGLTGMGLGRTDGRDFGLLGDLILKSGGYKSAKKSLIGMRCSAFGWLVHISPCISWLRIPGPVLRPALVRNTLTG